jgi:SAM-dependent MidA family methyltransferase
VGRHGDFITSVSTGELFGQLLAFQFGEWLENLKQFQRAGEPLKIIEAGAHDGKLAADILRWLKKKRAALFPEIEYVILEPSARRQQWQRETLKEFPNVRWAESHVSHFKSQICGIVFGNELLDAFPVHRLFWDSKSKKWFEWGVTFDNEKFCWEVIRHPKSTAIPQLCPADLKDVLPDGYTIELCPAAENWWREAAGILSHGKVLAIDYGYTTEEQFSPARMTGTLRAYFRHQVNYDLLANVGEQDLTAHVNFSAIQKTGESVGLKTQSFSTQPQFLTRIFAAAVKKNEFAKLDAKQVRQFQTLTHPEHLGRAFRVLVQSRKNHGNASR